MGVFRTGSYWGGGGEQIDTLSGNSNFSVPMVTAQGRTGWSVPVGLSYNSQNWRQDSGTNWNLGTDVGFGYGWRMQIGSITPYYNLGWTSGVDHYTFTDSTGAEYRLDQQSGTVWSSAQGIYVWFDSSTNILHFNNGTFWVMGSVSGGNEQDAGTMYPTVVEDVNGNQVLVWYAGSASLAGTMNSSARIAGIEDVRAVDPGYTWLYWQEEPYLSYEFSYANIHTDDPFPHLACVSATRSGPPETFGLGYSTVSTEPPFGTDPSYSGQSTNELTSVGVDLRRQRLLLAGLRLRRCGRARAGNLSLGRTSAVDLCDRELRRQPLISGDSEPVSGGGFGSRHRVDVSVHALRFRDDNCDSTCRYNARGRQRRGREEMDVQYKRVDMDLFRLLADVLAGRPGKGIYAAHKRDRDGADGRYVHLDAEYDQRESLYFHEDVGQGSGNVLGSECGDDADYGSVWQRDAGCGVSVQQHDYAAGDLQQFLSWRIISLELHPEPAFLGDSDGQRGHEDAGDKLLRHGDPAHVESVHNLHGRQQYIWGGGIRCGAAVAVASEGD